MKLFGEYTLCCGGRGSDFVRMCVVSDRRDDVRWKWIQTKVMNSRDDLRVICIHSCMGKGRALCGVTPM